MESWFALVVRHHPSADEPPLSSVTHAVPAEREGAGNEFEPRVGEQVGERARGGEKWGVAALWKWGINEGEARGVDREVGK